jgi:hypothetical protein
LKMKEERREEKELYQHQTTGNNITRTT